MFDLPHRLRLSTVALSVLSGGLAGCTATADLSYGEYQFGPGYQTERVYERRVYGDTDQGLGSEACRGVVRRQIDAFGNLIVRDDRVCDENAPEPVDGL